MPLLMEAKAENANKLEGGDSLEPLTPKKSSDLAAVFSKKECDTCLLLRPIEIVPGAKLPKPNPFSMTMYIHS